MTTTQPTLFDEADMQPVDLTELTLEGGPDLRVVYWNVVDERPCLVRCDNGERNRRTIRPLTTLCGISCAEVERTSAIPPAKVLYCMTCQSMAGNGVLR